MAKLWGVNIDGGYSWGLGWEGSWGTEIESRGFNHLGYRSQNSSGTAFACGRLGLYHGMSLWNLL